MAKGKKNLITPELENKVISAFKNLKNNTVKNVAKVCGLSYNHTSQIIDNYYKKKFDKSKNKKENGNN